MFPPSLISRGKSSNTFQTPYLLLTLLYSYLSFSSNAQAGHAHFYLRAFALADLGP